VLTLNPPIHGIFALHFYLLNRSAKAHIAVLLTNLFFAINYSFVKYISPSLVGPYALNLLRVGGSLLLFWTLWLFAKNKVPLNRKDTGRLIACGLLGVCLNQTLFIKGLTMTTAIHASLLMLCSPILITLLALWMLNERLTLLKIGGLLLGVAGSVLLIAGKQNTSQPKDYLLGDICIVLNGISYAFYFVLVKPLMERYTPLQVVRCGIYIWIYYDVAGWMDAVWTNSMAAIQWWRYRSSDLRDIGGNFFSLYVQCLRHPCTWPRSNECLHLYSIGLCSRHCRVVFQRAAYADEVSRRFDDSFRRLHRQFEKKKQITLLIINY
jgi:drug/metabolite transporter (DMT)-like permease